MPIQKCNVFSCYNGDVNNDLQKNRKLYKIFSTLGAIALIDTLLIGMEVPFLGALVLFPLLNLVFYEGIVFAIIGLFRLSWLPLFILAIIYNRKVMALEKVEGIERKTKGFSKGFNTLMLTLGILFFLLALLAIVLNL